jgi:hypothetical protein
MYIFGQQCENRFVVRFDIGNRRIKMATATLVGSGRTAVLNRIRQAPLKPTELLHADLGVKYSYTQIQDMLSDLLEKGDVVLTPDLILRPARSPESVEEK